MEGVATAASLERFGRALLDDIIGWPVEPKVLAITYMATNNLPVEEPAPPEHPNCRCEPEFG